MSISYGVLRYKKDFYYEVSVGIFWYGTLCEVGIYPLHLAASCEYS